MYGLSHWQYYCAGTQQLYKLCTYVSQGWIQGRGSHAALLLLYVSTVHVGKLVNVLLGYFTGNVPI